MTLLVLLHQARRAGTGVVVAAPRRSPLRAGAERIGVVCLGPDDELSGVVTDSVTGADLVLLDDAETFADRAVEPALLERVRRTGNGRTTVVTARSSELASAYRGLPAELRRCRTGLLLRPERGDGELLGVRLPPQSREVPPGRGCLAGAAGWLETGRTSGVLRVQVARVDLP
jgi:S-DNA-T family DNA segregation ATPase FtsK/SpoIIIE